MNKADTMDALGGEMKRMVEETKHLYEGQDDDSDNSSDNSEE